MVQHPAHLRLLLKVPAGKLMPYSQISFKRWLTNANSDYVSSSFKINAMIACKNVIFQAAWASPEPWTNLIFQHLERFRPHCSPLWPEQHFWTTSVQNNPMHSNLKKQIAKFCVHIGKFLVNMHDKNCKSRKIISTHKNDQCSKMNIGKLILYKKHGLSFHPWKFGCPFLH